MVRSVKRDLLAGFRRILRPLVRILLRNGVNFLEFAEVAKAAYVEVAAMDFPVSDRRMSQSRIAIVTGLSRKEVARVIADEGKDHSDEDESKFNRVIRVLAAWHMDSEFTGPYGIPLELEFENDPGKPSFQTLVRKYSGDMPARAMLDELLRVEIVHQDSTTGLLKVLGRTYIPEKLSAESIDHVANVVSHLAETLDNNLRIDATQKGLFQRTVETDRPVIWPDVWAFDEYVRDRCPQLLEEFDAWLSSRAKLERPDDEEKVMVGLGIYMFVEPTQPRPTLKGIFGEDEIK
jgi:hypothetical protein